MGFRQKRSCEDHFYSACTLIRNRLLQKKDTFGVFIVFKNAFDYGDRNVCYLSCYQMESMENVITP